MGEALRDPCFVRLLVILLFDGESIEYLINKYNEKSNAVHCPKKIKITLFKFMLSLHTISN